MDMTELQMNFSYGNARKTLVAEREMSKPQETCRGSARGLPEADTCQFLRFPALSVRRGGEGVACERCLADATTSGRIMIAGLTAHVPDEVVIASVRLIGVNSWRPSMLADPWAIEKAEGLTDAAKGQKPPSADPPSRLHVVTRIRGKSRIETVALELSGWK